MLFPVFCCRNRFENGAESVVVESQYELFPCGDDVWTLSSLQEFINKRVSQSVRLVLTRNQVTMASIRQMPHGVLSLRLHEGFLQAPHDVIDALVRYIRTHCREAWRVVSQFAADIEPINSRKGQGAKKTMGQVYDLKLIAESVNGQFFNGRVSCAICWGRQPVVRRGRRKSRSIRFGSWNAHTGCIRIHPQLDDERVPEEFVRYIVFHEMLHAVVPALRIQGRRYHHSAQFKALERTFPDLARMQKISRCLLDTILP